MSIIYHRNGDYLLPNMGLNETDKTPLNKYGRMRLRYLQEHRPGLYTRLILSGKLYEDLLETQKTAQDRVEIITDKMAKAQDISGGMKAKDQMAWVTQTQRRPESHGLSDDCGTGQQELLPGENLLLARQKSAAFPDIRRTDRLMPVYKEEKTNTWRVIYRYTDWKGERKQTSKRGFPTKREAQAWEREQLNKVTADVDMTFASFIDRYTEDMKTRLKENTWSTKEHIIRSKLNPYFGRLKLSNITPQQIITWQNELLNYRDAQGKPYSPVYLRTIQNQLSAIFNHAVRYYRLRENPCKKAGSMGKKKAREMLFWTKEEYLQFAKAIQDKPMAYHAFQMLYWCGIREGELLALTPADFDFSKETVTISKSYQRLKEKDVITDPKTEKSNRTITMPDFLAAEMQEYIGSLYRIQSDDRIFPFTSSLLHHEMERGCKACGVKKIRIHDLRHSAISLLIDMGFSPLAIADRVGHEAIEITYNYAHLFPSKQQDMAKQLSQAMQEAPEPPDKPPHAPQLTLIKNDSAA